MRFLFSFFLSALAAGLQPIAAQSSDSTFIRPSAQWRTSTEAIYPPTTGNGSFIRTQNRYFITEDTLVVNGMVHYKYYRAWGEEQGSFEKNSPDTIKSYQYKGIEYCGALREANHVIYLVPKGATESYPYYDFTMQLGDSLYCDNNMYGSRFMWLRQIDSVQVENGEKRKRFVFSFQKNQLPANIEDYAVSWIEGIGRSNGDFHSPATQSFMIVGNGDRYTARLRHFCVDNQRVYGTTACSDTIENPQYPQCAFMEFERAKWVVRDTRERMVFSEPTSKKRFNYDIFSVDTTHIIRDSGKVYRAYFQENLEVIVTYTPSPYKADTTYTYTQAHCIGGFRPAQDKVYYWDERRNGEYLLYDFGAKVGDIVSFGYDGQSYFLVASDSFANAKTEASPKKWNRQQQWRNIATGRLNLVTRWIPGPDASLPYGDTTDKITSYWLRETTREFSSCVEDSITRKPYYFDACTYVLPIPKAPAPPAWKPWLKDVQADWHVTTYYTRIDSPSAPPAVQHTIFSLSPTKSMTYRRFYGYRPVIRQSYIRRIDGQDTSFVYEDPIAIVGIRDYPCCVGYTTDSLLSNGERQLYDFRMQAGSTIDIMSQPHQLLRIDTATLASTQEQLRRQVLYNTITHDTAFVYEKYGTLYALPPIFSVNTRLLPASQWRADTLHQSVKLCIDQTTIASSYNGSQDELPCGYELPHSDNFALRVFPNPVREIATVYLTEKMRLFPEARIDILNAFGDILFTLPAKDRSVSFDIRGIAPGLYLCRYTNAIGVVQTSKIIVN